MLKTNPQKCYSHCSCCPWHTDRWKKTLVNYNKKLLNSFLKRKLAHNIYVILFSSQPDAIWDNLWLIMFKYHFWLGETSKKHFFNWQDFSLVKIKGNILKPNILSLFITSQLASFLYPLEFNNNQPKSIK